jgi:hypothetical protein
MQALQLTNKTRSLGKPADWNDEASNCVTLDILDIENGNFMVSVWQPSEEDLYKLNNGAAINLWIRGYNHPVVALSI